MPNNLSANRPASSDEFLNQTWLPAGWSDLNVAVALSGGADSVSLLRAISELKLKQSGAGQLLALHVNHQLRGSDSSADVDWCRQLCESLSIRLEVLTCDTAQYAAEAGEGIEAAAREQRYQLLTSAAEQAGVRYLATAHTRDDQVETVLFRLLRGTGLRGLSGIPRTRALTPSLTLIRPLLDCSRKNVIAYLSDLRQAYRTDRTNTDPQFTRNRLRHELLPQLREQYNQELDTALVRLSSQASDAQQAVELQSRRLLDEANLVMNSSSLAFRWQCFTEHQPVIVTEAIRIAWRKAELAEQAMHHDWWTRLTDMVLSPSKNEVFNLPGKVRASIASELFLLEW